MYLCFVIILKGERSWTCWIHNMEINISTFSLILGHVVSSKKYLSADQTCMEGFQLTSLKSERSLCCWLDSAEMKPEYSQTNSCRDFETQISRNWGVSDVLFPVCVTTDMFDVPVRESEASSDPDITQLFHQGWLSWDSSTAFMTARTKISPGLFLSSFFSLFSSLLSENERPSYDSVEEKVSYLITAIFGEVYGPLFFPRN